MSTTVGAPKRTRVITYVVLGVIVLILIVTGLLLYESGEESREANAKADQLTAQLTELGVSSPSREQIVGVLGDDGGPICAADPNNGLVRASLASMLSNGAGGPGTRPIIADRKFVQGTLAVVSVYCPEKLQEFQEHVDSLTTDDVAG